jgi:hypothetical protein
MPKDLHPEEPESCGTLLDGHERCQWSERLEAEGNQLLILRQNSSGPDLRPFERKSFRKNCDAYGRDDHFEDP